MSAAPAKLTEEQRMWAAHQARVRADNLEWRWWRLREVAALQEATLCAWMLALLEQIERESEDV